jgi:hypothetical protein
MLLSAAIEALEKNRLQLGGVWNPTGEYRDDKLIVVSQTEVAGTTLSPGSKVGVAVDLASKSQGVSSVRIWNETADDHLLHVWAFDFGSGQRTDLGQIAFNAHLDFPPASGHLYQVAAIDPAWCGANDPTDYACMRWWVNVQGDSGGPAIGFTIY